MSKKSGESKSTILGSYLDGVACLVDFGDALPKRRGYSFAYKTMHRGHTVVAAWARTGQRLTDCMAKETGPVGKPAGTPKS